MHFAFDGDFRIGWDRQARVFAENDIDGFAADAAGIVVFGSAPWHVVGCGHEQERIVAEADGDGKRLALIEIFLAHDAPVLARRDVERESIAIVHHDAVATEIDPTLVDVAGDHQMRGAEVAPAVFLMPARHGQGKQIDIFAFENILHHRSALNDRAAE